MSKARNPYVDGTGRLQTVDQDHAPLYWALINAFKERTGVPIVLNHKGDTIVKTAGGSRIQD